MGGVPAGYKSLLFGIYLLFLPVTSLFMKLKHLIFCALVWLTLPLVVKAQDDRKDKTAVTYEEIYDEPYSVNKLFVQFQPLYGELFVTNVNAGFGFETAYYYQDKADFKAHFRKTYSSQFFDLSRDLAIKNSDVDNDPQIFNYFEVGGTYHIKDFDEPSKTKMVLYKKSYKGNKWAARVPLVAEVPCKVRKIYGARLGAIAWKSSTDVNRVMKDQDLSQEDFVDDEGNTMADVTAGEDINIFSNISSTGLYVGGSMTWIRNVAVSFDKYEAGVDDLIFTAFFDILVSPSLPVDNIVYTVKDDDGVAIGPTYTFDSSPIDVRKFGFRAGIEGKFNRTLGWSYGGEIGYRPGIVGRNFFALIKISFPVFSTNLDYKVESFGK